MKTKNNEKRELAITEDQLKNEIWLAVKMNNNYEISSLGRLRHTYKNGNTKIIKPSSNGGKRKYLFYIINDVKIYVHHLVLFTFQCKRPSSEYECDHIDNDPKNNTIDNLRWVLKSENRSHKGEAHPKSKLSNSKVKLIRALLAEHKDDVGTQKKLAAMFEVSASSISSIIRRKTWAHI
ncbi:hypothetical protein E0W68_02225 [Flavobacterium salilacus subsp. salilacus]|uniref:HNH endonuclease n=1 Tax=Flavobacterium TaxID=237 RepID=UPI001074B012|nr:MULTISPECIES: HNH endonuclease [Flavobacterium]KAF2520059.1 hypothetical protein E0W68_02225 [Flavobacterium salilacus subsp. salilacus]MBE1614025.1 HNH endonuclease [Flavobacterium sp. SaA2.13]